tara:strand:- start:319 stop:555 length:237 start_codon:yes stop_codon:yes gene_type:complete
MRKELVFDVNNNMWTTDWEGKTLEILMAGNEYTIKLNSNTLHEKTDIMNLLNILTDMTGKKPLFLSERRESARPNTDC